MNVGQARQAQLQGEAANNMIGRSLQRRELSVNVLVIENGYLISLYYTNPVTLIYENKQFYACTVAELGQKIEALFHEYNSTTNE